MGARDDEGEGEGKGEDEVKDEGEDEGGDEGMDGWEGRFDDGCEDEVDEYVCAAVEEEGSRPPGLLVVGKSCGVLWNGNQKWVVEDGFRGLEDFGPADDMTALRELAGSPAIAAG